MLLVSRLPGSLKKTVSRPSMLSFWRPNALQSGPRELPQGGKHPSNIVTKTSPSRRGHPPARFEANKLSPEGGTPYPLKNTPNYIKTRDNKHRAHHRTPTAKQNKLNRQGNAARRDRISLRHGGGSGRRPIGYEQKEYTKLCIGQITYTC